MVREPVIDLFAGENRWLSNFYPCRVELDGEFYPSVEHAYQAAKTTDSASRLWIKSADTASQAKRRGGRVRLRPDWEDLKLAVMELLLDQKFRKPELKAKLLATSGQELIEGNYWGDRFWGVCGGKGHNHLGKLLMKLRDSL